MVGEEPEIELASVMPLSGQKLTSPIIFALY
jgi:hypothetical protein